MLRMARAMVATDSRTPNSRTRNNRRRSMSKGIARIAELVVWERGFLGSVSSNQILLSSRRRNVSWFVVELWSREFLHATLWRRVGWWLGKWIWRWLLFGNFFVRVPMFIGQRHDHSEQLLQQRRLDRKRVLLEPRTKFL